MKKENKVSASEMLKNELGLTKAESLFCDLYINGGREFAGQHCKCYREAFQDSGSGVSLKSRRLLGKTHISERIKKLSEQQQTDTEAIAVKLQVTETLKSVMEETSTAKYKDKWGMDLSPAPLRAVAVNAAKALMDLYPIKHAQEAKLKIEGGGDNGIIFNVIYNPQNEMFRLLGTKRSFSQNETFFFSHPYPLYPALFRLISHF